MTSFDPHYGARVSPETTYEQATTTNDTTDMMIVEQQQHQPQSVEHVLRLLAQAWNRLDLTELGYLLGTTRTRKIYLRDMANVRQAKNDVYYSLGGEGRLAFRDLFLTLPERKLQEFFLQCASTCLAQNRFMNPNVDLVTILQYARGKHAMTTNTTSRPAKRHCSSSRNDFYVVQDDGY